MASKENRSFVPHKTKSTDSLSVWYYFWPEETGHAAAKCMMCSSIIKTTNSNTRGLLSHLSGKHNINLKEIRLKSQRNQQKDPLGSYAIATYIPHTKDDDKCSVWHYFLQQEGRRISVKCKICSCILKTVNSTTSPMLTHLNARHNIDLRRIRLKNLAIK
nr:unnamed protein product [Callosobruchus analis]